MSLCLVTCLSVPRYACLCISLSLSLTVTLQYPSEMFAMNHDK